MKIYCFKTQPRYIISGSHVSITTTEFPRIDISLCNLINN